MFLIDFIINILVIMFTILESFVEIRSLMQQKRPFMEESKLILVHTLYPDTLGWFYSHKFNLKKPWILEIRG